MVCGFSPAAMECAAMMVSRGAAVYVYGGALPPSSVLSEIQASVFHDITDILPHAESWYILDFTPIASSADIPAYVRDLIAQSTVIYSAAAAACTATALSQWTGITATSLIGGMAGFTRNTSIECSVSLSAAPEIAAQLTAVWQSLGYMVNLVEDRVGLIAPRILATLINEAAFAVMEGVASVSDIDKAMTLGVNYPKGLLLWADEIGLDYILALLDGLYDEYHQERYRAAVILRQYVRAGYTGKAAGRGFYTY